MNNSGIKSQTLGRATVSGQLFENPDGTEIAVKTDYFGKKRDKFNPTAGPFENISKGSNKLKVW